jgi:hypothetical protein
MDNAKDPLLQIKVLESEYKRLKNEYKGLQIQDLKWLDSTSEEGKKAMEIDENMKNILRTLTTLIKNYTETNPTKGQYNELLSKYDSLQKYKHSKVDYKQRIEDNKILIGMNSYYIVLWTCLILCLSLLLFVDK